jgi:ubiquinone/menaquinone biosynthesis C-methylase UbiE
MSMSGLDISSNMLKQAKKLRGNSLNGCQLDIGDATDLLYSDNSFDLVVCFRFLDSHVSYRDTIKAIVEYCRVSQKYLILELGAIPQKEDDSVLTLENLNMDLPISSKLSEIERQKLLESNGLKILQSEFACHVDGTPHTNIYLCEKL